MTVTLRNYELYAGSANPLVGASVALYAATTAHPNPGPVLSTTLTDSSGMWQFVAIADGQYDVKVTAPGAGLVKWYKGNVAIGTILTGLTPDDNTVTSAKIVDGAVTSAKILDGTILNVDVNAAAAIALSKLAAGSSGVLKSNGTVISAGNQIVAADITTDTITATQLAADSVGASELADNSVASANIIDDSIVNADVNSAAAIAVTKIAHVGSGNVLRSNGTTNAAGQVASGDIAAGAIHQIVSLAGISSTPTTILTSPADMPNMTTPSYTVTAGSTLLILFSALVYGDAAGMFIAFTIVHNGAQVLQRSVQTKGISIMENLMSFVTVPVGSTASVVTKAQWHVSSGTGTNPGTERSLTVIELKK